MATSPTLLKDLLLLNLQQQPIYRNLPPAAKTILNQQIEKFSVPSIQSIGKQVGSFSNQTIFNSQNNTIGTKNPYNIVNSNQTPNQLQNTLSPTIKGVLNSGLANDLYFKIINEFNTKLPPALRNVIDINALTSVIQAGVNTVVDRGIDSKLTDYASDLFSGKTKFNLSVPSLNSLFSTDPTNALGSIGQKFDKNISNKALTDSQKFNVNSPENREKLITQTQGFIDPNAEYPTKDYKGQPETNKLARGIVNNTIVQKKENERLKGIQLPNNQYWEEPPVPYKGQYPYNKVTQTESGHIIEIDDTSGAERIHVYHKSGTYMEIDANGSIVRRTKGSSYEIIDKNGYISVSGDASLSVKGSVKIYVGNDADIEVDGDVNIQCKNDITMMAAGRVDISATEEINLHSANVNIEADVNLSLKGDINAFLTTTDLYTKANNNSYHEVLKNAYNKTGESFYVQAAESVYQKAGTSIFNQASSEIHNKSGGSFNADGSQVYLNSGTSSASQNATASKYSYSANIGMIGDRKFVVYETIEDPIASNYLDELGYAAEDSDNQGERDKQRTNLKNKGIASDSDLDEKGVAIDSDSPSRSITTVIKPDVSLIKQTYLPDNYQLSKHFTLGDLTTKPAVSKNKLVAQSGLTYGEIAYNLSALALNVLEPILALYPDMVLTSVFRLAASSSSNSDHPKGCAADIQFPGASKKQYYEIAKKIATQVNYDQLLLEYKTHGTGLPWIHIGFRVDNSRGQVLTVFNDKTYGQGLTYLA